MTSNEIRIELLEKIYILALKGSNNAQIAQEVQLSRERIRQILYAFRKLGAPLPKLTGSEKRNLLLQIIEKHKDETFSDAHKETKKRYDKIYCYAKQAKTAVEIAEITGYRINEIRWAIISFRRNKADIPYIRGEPPILSIMKKYETDKSKEPS